MPGADSESVEKDNRIQCWVRDIFVRIRIRGSVPLTNGSVSNSGSDSFLITFFLFFLYLYPPTRTLSSVLKIIFLLKFCVQILFCKHYLSSLITFVKKGKDPVPDPYL
jgi:hypothetical protein